MTTNPIGQPKGKRRRWRQFSLRTMFVLLTVAAVLLALLSPSLVERRREQAVVRTIEAAGGRVTVYDYEPKFGATVFSAVLGSRIYMRVREVDLGGSGFKDADLVQFHRLTRLRKLSLSGTKVTDAGLPHLKRNANLESLNLSKTLVTDTALQHLREFSSLERLNTVGTQITYEGLGELQKALPDASRLTQQRAIDEIRAAGGLVSREVDAVHNFFGRRGSIDPRHLEYLPNLKTLRFGSGNVTGNLLSGLESVPQLEEIYFTHSQITNKDLEHLKPLTKLKVVSLKWTGVDDDALAHLAGLSNLRELHLDGTNVTGLGFRHLKGLSQLEVLDLTGCQYIYDADLEDLPCLKRLRCVVLRNARVTATGMALLRKALPNAQIIVGEPQQHLGRLSPTAEAGLPVEGETAFWAGDYETMTRVLQFVTGFQSSWQGYMWLGHAYQLSGLWQQAVRAYKMALDQLEREAIATPIRLPGNSQQPSRRELHNEWAKLVLLTGRIELEELKDPAAAAKTLAKGLHFAPKANRPLNEIATEAATVIDGLENPLGTRPFNERLWSDLMYPLTTHRYLALAHEQLGDVKAALECWLRIRLCRVGYKVAMANTDPQHIAALWLKLPDSEPLPPMPVFSVLTEQQPEVTLKPTTGQSRLTWWGNNAWDTFAMIASPGRAVASLEITCALSQDLDGSAAALQFWADAESYYAAEKRRLLQYRWPKGKASGREIRTYKVSVPYDANVLFIKSPDKSTTEIKVRATLRPRGQGAEWPGAQPPQLSREAWRLSVDFPDSPFRPVSSETSSEPYVGRGTSSLVRMPDGRFLLAFGEKKIVLAASDDGVVWEDPWEYAHNSVFPTGNSTMLVDDDGVIWMLYSSKRPGTDQFSTGHYYLWLTKSHDGRSWSRPKPIRTAGMLSNNTTAQMTRSPDGKYWILSDDQVGSGDSPEDIRELRRLLIPIRDNSTPTHAHATFGSDGRCHLVFVLHGRKRNVEYSQSDDMRLWSPPRTLFEDSKSTAEILQLLIDGDRVALVYTNNKGGWIRRGTMEHDGPHLTQAVQFAGQRTGVYGWRITPEGDKIYLPLIGNPPGLLVADTDDLLAEQP